MSSWPSCTSTPPADDLSSETAHHYRQALVHYEQAKDKVDTSTTVEDVLASEQLLADAHYHRAAVLALVAGEPLPARREPCFFDPRHGPSMSDVDWTPLGGVARTVPVCAADARRLAGGEAPVTRLIRIGDRYVPVHEAGGVAAILDSHRSLMNERPTSRNRKNMAEAHLRARGIGATFGGGGAGGEGSGDSGGGGQ
ncbi:hypothetical protein [Nocardioides sp. B-3]|uniref:hypothetical protein n=1 Tax=Nocardioides sp. B-3 TaxID=2895565 RepID=UPI0021535B7E|nr:hypothetical protein [Nocardioides sp. B-3]UUZ58055.1 hypothetical protein LP418_17300 [Nocardioides sp. B-3]